MSRVGYGGALATLAGLSHLQQWDRGLAGQDIPYSVSYAAV